MLVKFQTAYPNIIQLLREVLNEDPEHPEALYQLGVFSIQSQQWQNGLNRFTLLKQAHGYTEYEDAYYYEALCLASLDSLNAAKSLIDEGLMVVQDSSLIVSLTQFRNTIINLYYNLYTHLNDGKQYF